MKQVGRIVNRILISCFPFFLIAVVVILPQELCAQTFGVNSAQLAEEITFTLWYYGEPAPVFDLSEQPNSQPNPANPGDQGFDRQAFNQSWVFDPSLQLDLARRGTVGAVLAMARDILSGMIYGYDFEYIPGDRVRAITESFTLTPRNLIPWGDPGLTLVSVSRANLPIEDLIQVQFRYRLNEHQLLIRRGWLGTRFQNSRAQGAASLFLDMAGQQQALVNGAKEAVRAHARRLTRDKPAEVTGVAILSDAPRFWTSQGRFLSDVQLQLQVQTIREYLVF
jgi:hypothetical protein